MPPNELPRRESARLITPLAIAAGYAAGAGAWIVYSDAFLAEFVRNGNTFLPWETFKGLIFVLATALLLYTALRHQRGTIAKTRAELTHAWHLQAEILDALPDIVVTVDESGRINRWNKHALRVTGYLESEVTGAEALKFIAPEDADRAAQALHALLETGQQIAVDAKIRFKDNSFHPYQLIGTPLEIKHGQTAGAIITGRDIRDRLEAEERQRRKLEGYETTLEQAVAAMAAIIEKRDRYLAAHQDRVTQIAVAIADRLGIEPNARHALRLASICHDIGKIAIPNEILSKPGRITGAELELIRAHPETGYEILSHVDFPWPIADIVRQHHERIDGSGYPHGLIGDEIRLEARILAVADVVEAMTSHRPYRPALGLDVALTEIKVNSGKFYDPQVVDACLAVFREKQYRSGIEAA